MIKVFFGWLAVQYIFARVLFFGALNMWKSMNLSPDYLSSFVAPATLVILAETIVSAYILVSNAVSREAASREYRR